MTADYYATIITDYYATIITTAMKENVPMSVKIATIDGEEIAIWFTPDHIVLAKGMDFTSDSKSTLDLATVLHVYNGLRGWLAHQAQIRKMNGEDPTQFGNPVGKPEGDNG